MAARPDLVTGIVRPRSIAEACELRAELPDWTVVAGGTDVMVEVNASRLMPRGWLSLDRVAGLATASNDDVTRILGAGCTFTSLLRMARPELDALNRAARTIGSPQIRNAATVGGNIATASPAGDSLPPLLCYDAAVTLTSVRGTRELALADLLVGPKQTAIAPDELITSISLPRTVGRQVFSKVGPRNAMVIARCALAARFDPEIGEARVAIGAVAPTARRAPEAERALVEGADAEEFAHAVRRAAEPIDDVRGSAAYRLHALGVLARRAHARLVT